MNKLEHTPIPGDHLAQRGVSPFPRTVYSPSEQTFRTMCWGKGGCQVYLQLPLIFKRKSSFLCSQGFVILWFMVKKKKCIFSLSFWHRAIKTFENSSVDSSKDNLCYGHEVTGYFKDGSWFPRDQSCDWKVGTFSLIPWIPRERGGAGGWADQQWPII